MTVVNQKGGVAKTTTTINLASSYANLGKRVLLLDLDSQCNLTEGLGVDQNPKIESMNVRSAIEQKLGIDKVLLSTKIPGVDIVAGSESLDEVKNAFIGKPSQYSLITRMLKSTALNDYDIVLIDTNPSKDIVVQAALVASHYYLIPMKPSRYSASGLAKQLELIEEIRESGLNPMLTPLGAVITMFKSTNRNHQKFEAIIRKIAKDCRLKVLNTVIPHSDAAEGAEGSSEPLLSYNKNLPVTHAYTSLAGEILPELRGQRKGRRLQGANIGGLEKADDDFLELDL